jgi:hypothetical protein
MRRLAFLLILLMVLPPQIYAGNPHAGHPSSPGLWSVLKAEFHAMFFTPQTWYVRADGGTRVSTNVPAGLCDGLSDLPAAGATAKHCAFNSVRYLWDDNFSGNNGQGTWVIAGGDTVVIRDCMALPSELNPSNPNCRIGWNDNSTGNDPNNWCKNIGANGCFSPPIPAGTAGNHTKILGACAFGTYTCTPITPAGFPYGTTNLTQIFGGMDLGYTLNLSSTQYVDVEGLEITAHNGGCTTSGTPIYPKHCSTNPPYDDFGASGVLFDNSSSNITLQDVYIHGFESWGMFGPIGGPITLTRVFVGFNGTGGWGFDDGHSTPNAAGSSLFMSYVALIGNGCHEEYPIIHTLFPAQACYDSVNNGFGDGLSGQDAILDNFTFDHSLILYNTKDGFIGPHTQITTMVITNSAAIGNMGAQWKWNQTPGGTLTFQGNLTATNCFRMSQTLPGAVHNFALSTGNTGAGLSNFCRAAENGFAVITRNHTTNHYYGNTVVGANATMIQQDCGVYLPGNNFSQEHDCNTSQLLWTGNNFIGFDDPSDGGPQTALFFASDSSITFTSDHNNQWNVRNGAPCTGTITCVDPKMVGQPAIPWPGSEAGLDAFNPFAGTGNSFYPSSISPLLGAGTPLTGMTTDYYATPRPNPPSLGGAELSGAPARTLVSMAITPNPGTVTSTLAMTCTSTFSDSSTAASSSPVWTDTAAHSSINSSTGVVTAVSAGSDTITATIGGIHATATVNVPAPAATTIQGFGTFQVTGRQ